MKLNLRVYECFKQTKHNTTQIVLKIETVLVLMSNVKVGYAKKMVLLCLAFPFISSLSTISHLILFFLICCCVLVRGNGNVQSLLLVVWNYKYIWFHFGFVVFFCHCGREIEVEKKRGSFKWNAYEIIILWVLSKGINSLNFLYLFHINFIDQTDRKEKPLNEIRKFIESVMEFLNTIHQSSLLQLSLSLKWKVTMKNQFTHSNIITKTNGI